MAFLNNLQLLFWASVTLKLLLEISVFHLMGYPWILVASLVTTEAYNNLAFVFRVFATLQLQLLLLATMQLLLLVV